MAADTTTDYTPNKDHIGLTDTFASRRYFAKFERITQHLTRVAAVMQAEGNLRRDEVEILTSYVQRIAYTFRALSMKYLLVGRDRGKLFGSLAMDIQESGFPVFNEILLMANDAQQASLHLAHTPPGDKLKQQMVEQIISTRQIPYYYCEEIGRASQ